MQKYLLFTGIFLCVSISTMAQKSRVISANNLLESASYQDAKEAIDLAVINPKTADWHRTYLVKGLLCQSAFEAGFEEEDEKKIKLYPDQLYLAYDSYEKALELDSKKRIHSSVETQYYELANSFQKLGQRHYLRREYVQALKAFEFAMEVSKSPLISVKIDTSLIYNTAMAAYESRSWDKAVKYLSGLDKDSYSPETSLLLQKAYLAVGDSISGEDVLIEGVVKYEYNQTIVLQLVDLYVDASRWVEAFVLMDSAILHQPENHYFPWTRGLLYQNLEQYELAIEDLLYASKLDPEEITIYYNLGVCYYNMGVKIDKKALQIRNNREYRAIRTEAKLSFEKAVVWFEKSYEANPTDQPTILKLYQLYSRLDMTQKRDYMKRLIR